MNAINGLGGIHPLQSTQNVSAKPPVQPPTETRVSAKDRLELSGMSHLMASLKTADVRLDKVAAIRDQIAADTYDADGTKLDGAVDKMLGDLLK